MRNFVLFSLSLLCLGIPIAAHADTTTYKLSGSYIRPIGDHPVVQLSGTLTVDTTTGVIQNVDFRFPDINLNGVGLTWGTDHYLNDTEIWEDFITPPNSFLGAIDILIPTTSLVGYHGGEVCSLEHPCDKALSVAARHLDAAPLTEASLTKVAEAPEPSSLVLLGTAAMAGIELARRRLFVH